jgi:fido (protein-threonine AMPylation protein)
VNEHIRHSNLIEGIDSRAEDTRSRAAWQWLEKQTIIWPSTMLELHRRITVKQLPETQAGHFRTVHVRVGNHVPPPPVIAQAQIIDWTLELMKNWHNLDPKAMHIRFEQIHPFIDGNGRTGRMLMWWHEKKLGREPTLIRSNEVGRFDYYSWFKDA